MISSSLLLCAVRCHALHHNHDARPHTVRSRSIGRHVQVDTPPSATPPRGYVVSRITRHSLARHHPVVPRTRIRSRSSPFRPQSKDITRGTAVLQPPHGSCVQDGRYERHIL